MKKSLIGVAIGLGLLASGGPATADTLTFKEVSGLSFEQYLLVTPELSNEMMFSVSGFSYQFDSLNFSFVDFPGFVVPATPANANNDLVAFFDDSTNTNVNLLHTQSYLVKVFGHANTGITGGLGIVTVNALGATIVPVPEPESYAMLLAGLGLLGLIARRRAKAAA
jgi:hypothetical protein